MNTFEIFSALCIILLKSFSFQLTIVTYIKEIQSHGKIPQLEETTIAKTEEDRLEMCRHGFWQIQQYNIWNSGGKAVFLEGTATEEMKIYIFKEAEVHSIRAAPAVKCPTDPESYIHINLNEKRKKNQPLFQVLCKQSSPRPVLERIMYQMVKVIDIIEVDITDWISTSKSSTGINLKGIPVYDTEELNDDQRLQICIKGMQTVPKLNIELKKDTKTCTNKYYSVTKFSKGSFRTHEEIIEAFECPTEPKIYISMGEELSKMDKWSTMTRREFTEIGLLWVVMKTTDGDRKLTASDKLGAYSSRETAEAFYHQIRRNDKDTKLDQVIDLKEQTRICRSIFKDLIHKKDGTEVDKNCRILNSTGFRDVYDELKTENKNLCERYYKNSDSVFISGQDIVVLNGPESIDVKAPETEESVSEDLFVCLIRTNWRDTEEYFFSKEYNMNFDPKNSVSDYLAGRFYFKRNPNNSVVMMGMIEEFAKVLETSNVEMLFLKRRKRRELAKTDSDDPICKLNNVERSRVCSLVFEFLDEPIKPTPLHTLGCAKNPITLTTDDRLKVAKGNQYDEWMISCYETAPRNDTFKVYYLSQAYDKSKLSSSSDVFAYAREARSEKIFLQKAYTDPRIGNLLTKK